MLIYRNAKGVDVQENCIGYVKTYLNAN